MKTSKRKHHSATLLFLLLGAALIGLMHFLELKYTPENQVLKIAIHTGIEIGIAGISVALIGILLETPHWTRYIEKRLLNIVIGSEFLAQLSPESVSNLYDNVLVHKYGDDIKAPDSLYNYFKSKLFDEIDSPYRVDYSIKIDVRRNGNYLEYEEELVYTCIKVRNKFQDHVSWSYAETDFKNAEILSLEIYEPNKQVQEVDLSRFTIDKIGALHQFEFPLKEFNSADELTVKLKVRYTGLMGKLWSVIQTYPVKNISSLYIAYDKSLALQIEYFGIDENEVEKQIIRTGEYSAKYNNWLPKRFGFVLLLTDRGPLSPNLHIA